MKAVRTKATFAGVEFSGFQKAVAHISVPMPTLRKILRSGNVIAYRNYRYTDDYAGDAAQKFGKGEVGTNELADSVGEYGKPWLCYLDTESNRVRYCPMQSEAYTIWDKSDEALAGRREGSN